MFSPNTSATDGTYFVEKEGESTVSMFDLFWVWRRRRVKKKGRERKRKRERVRTTRQRARIQTPEATGQQQQ